MVEVRQHKKQFRKLVRRKRGEPEEVAWTASVVVVVPGPRFAQWVDKNQATNGYIIFTV